MNLKELKEIKHRLYIKEYWNKPEETECYNIPLTLSGMIALKEIDNFLVGTSYYMGLAYFWDHEVKHWLRDSTPFKRVKIHKLFIANKIPFDKKEKYFISNKLAEQICLKVCKK